MKTKQEDGLEGYIGREEKMVLKATLAEKENGGFIQLAISMFYGHYGHWTTMENSLRSKEYWNTVENGIPILATNLTQE